MSEASAPRAGVAGWPVDHSRSPTIHRYWLKELGLKGTYERFAVRPGEFREFAATIGKDGLLGANVTAPHKEAAFAACDRRTPVAEALGAVNTLWREGGRLMGDNTDVAGFLANMDEAAPGWTKRRRSAVVIGAGGAARAIVHALISRGFQRIAIANRTQARAEALAAHFGGPATAISWADLPAELSQADLLVNASSLGMTGQPPLRLDLRALPERAVVADAVYVPLRTPLIEGARARGLRFAEGLGMLLHQAAPAFTRWFGERPRVTPELRALIEAEVQGKREAAR
ncbi:MAG TPA: shikimate dehydrogenase [Roseiarcus sp.]|nr:shikimate dehydrogenase [Roseiarcus sp.]